MAEKVGIIAGATAPRSKLFYKDGANWVKVPGIDSFSLAKGEAASESYDTWDGTLSVLGNTPIGDVTFNVGSYLPNHKAWKDLDARKKNSQNVQVRVETPEREIFTSDTDARIAIATDGSVTFSGSGEGSKSGDLKDVTAGHAFKIGSKIFNIDSFTDATTPVVKTEAIATAQAAAAYKVVMPALRWEFTAGIKQIGGAELSDGTLGSSLILTPISETNIAKAVPTATDA